MTNVLLVKFTRPIVAGALLLILSCGLANGQSDELRRTLFKDADAALKTAQETEAAIYSPTTFASGMNFYKKADEELQKGEEIKDIQKNIASATDAFSKSVELAKRSSAFFSSVIIARNEAKQEEAEKYAPDLWEKAEARLGEAIKALESANDSSARAKGVETETTYREATLASVKLQCLGETQSLLVKAEESGAKKNAPITFDRAVRVLQKAEKSLEENPRGKEEARKLASQAQYEIQHAIYLSQAISRINAEKKSLEAILLEAETPLQNIANTLGATVRFDQGTGPATEEITAAIRGLK